MALDLSGISNVNEFYSHHYLDALLESDVKDLLQKWDTAEKEDNRTPPHKSLAACTEAYFKAKAKAAETVNDEDRWEETHPFNVRLLEALGYEYQAGAFEFIGDDQIIPVLSSLKGMVTPTSGSLTHRSRRLMRPTPFRPSSRASCRQKTGRSP